MRNKKLKITDKPNILRRLEKSTIKDPISMCWLWYGSKNPKGYGNCQIDKIVYVVSRLSLYIFKGFNLFSKLQALHIVECKNKNCWNPEHLYAGTCGQNQSDSVKAGTHHEAKMTHCKRGHEFTIENTIISNDLLRKRTCRICKMAANRRSLLRN